MLGLDAEASTTYCIRLVFREKKGHRRHPKTLFHAVGERKRAEEGIDVAGFSLYGDEGCVLESDGGVCVCWEGYDVVGAGCEHMQALYLIRFDFTPLFSACCRIGSTQAKIMADLGSALKSASTELTLRAKQL